MSALTSSEPGIIVDDIVYWYRSHPEQSLKAGAYTELEPFVRRIAFACHEAVLTLE